jgi:serine protease
VCLLIARVFGDDGIQSFSFILQAAEWCGDNGARTINMSLGTRSKSIAGSQIFQELRNEGVLVVASAGNSGDNTKDYPASYDDVVSVAAINDSNKRARFSQFNDQVNLSAPGVQILSSTAGEGYSKYDGTSMASSHVAGVAAKIWAARPQCTNEQVREALQNTALDLGDAGRDDMFGFGLVQAVDAYNYLLAFEPPCGGTIPSETSCKGSFEDCSDDSECCSNRCIPLAIGDANRICRSAPKANKAKLTAGRGGAGGGGQGGGRTKRIRGR